VGKIFTKVEFFEAHEAGFQGNNNILNFNQCVFVLVFAVHERSSLGCGQGFMCIESSISHIIEVRQRLKVISDPVPNIHLPTCRLQCKTKSTTPKKKSSTNLACLKPHSTGSSADSVLPVREGCFHPLMPKNYGVRYGAKPTEFRPNLVMRQIETW
jgi:hypothetical protein